MNHIILTDNQLNGWEYGMLRSFESAIKNITIAEEVVFPAVKFPNFIEKRIGHGMRLAFLRNCLPKIKLDFAADVLWYVIMGPEDYRLDRYKMSKEPNIKILYLYDTLPSQYKLIKKIVKTHNWDILITSFADAVSDLIEITGKSWYCVPQAADDRLFDQLPFDDKVIHFSSYGRRDPLLHEALKDFCSKKSLYYDYTTHNGRNPIACPKDLYRQYGWHLNRSLFTICLPVEVTNSNRAGHLHPITCRWFEASAAGCIIVGKSPCNKAFIDYFGSDFVLDIGDMSNKNDIMKTLDFFWENRKLIFNNKIKNYTIYTWNSRVYEVLDIIKYHTSPI